MLAALVSGALPAARAEVSPRMPGPSSASYVRGSREAENAACARCHAALAREHASGLHRRAFVDPSFQRGYAAEPRPFCRGCHAPESPPDREPDAFARTEGVACVTCHEPEGGAILAPAAGSGRTSNRKGSPPPHPVRRIVDFGTVACARCHEFAFPGAPSVSGEGDLMQKTMLEHRRSGEAASACSACHMKPAPDGRASHGFGVRDDASLLRSALEIRAERRPDPEGSRVIVTLETRGVGHSFPTGDLFRRVLLRMKTPLGPIERTFGRSFRTATGPGDVGAHQVEASDTRLSPRAEVEIVVPPAARVEYAVVYQRVIAVERTPPFDVTVEAETLLGQGAL